MAVLYANEPGVRSMPTWESAAEERKAAAQARAAGAEQLGYYRRGASGPVAVSVPCGSARSLAFPSRIELRMVERDGQDLYQLHGQANTYEQPYEMWDMFGPYNEGIRQAAGSASLAAKPDVAFLTNHRGITMARTTNRTLELTESTAGLDYDAYVNPKRQDVRDLVTAVEDELITESSFAFMIERGSWSDDFTEFWIEAYDINRGDVSAVNYGANPYTSVGARAREVLADLEQLPVGAARAAMARLAGREDLSPPVTAPDENGMDLARVSAWLLQHS